MLEKALALGMTEGEYNALLERLGREPSSTELAMVSVEWSEHCGYPRSKDLLRLLPKEGHYASVSGADTGGIEVEPGLTVVFKMESHNHPSQVEPRQGAATGIGGIVRDIFTVGARPIANLNSLRFGLLDDPQHGALARYLFAGVVDGISFYGNCLAPEETITVRRGTNVQTLPIGEWCESIIKDGTDAAQPVAEVLSFDPQNNRATWNEVEAVFRRRSDELVTISSALGRKWRVTPDHPMLVWQDDEWDVKAAGELSKGAVLPFIETLEDNCPVSHDKVTCIKRESGEFPVYDLQVADSHLFVTSGGLITHNCLGIPTVAGEVGFNPSYRGNCLVGAMSVGVVESDKIASSAARGVGNTVMYFGNATGRDGIGGCSILASHDLTDLEQRPSVQVGDPYAEKCLLEATLEALQTGAVVSMKDMGAAGLTCTTCEQAADGQDRFGENVGMDIDLDRVPLREADMEAFEIMMSESQERMLGVIERGREEEVAAIFRKWNTHAVPIGVVTDDGQITIRRGGEVVAQIGAKTLVEAPRYNLPREEPSYLAQKHDFDFGRVPVPGDWGAVFRRLLQSPNIASKEWVFRQYDHMVQINTLVRPGEGDAAVLRLRESQTGKGLALKADCNSRYVYLDPFVGSQIAIAECARNIVCAGGEPAGVTDCLCFGNPEKPDRFWSFARSIEGIAQACRHFRLPVVSGNVSLYNETSESAIHPSPLIGMVGVVQNVDQAMGMGFRDSGDLVVLLGDCTDELGGSEYLFVEHGLEEGRPPHLDLERELNVQKLTLALIRRGLVKSAHDCSDGGLAVALAESCIAGGVGAQIEFSERMAAPDTRLDALLFGEAQSRVVISIARNQMSEVRRMAGVVGVPVHALGVVGGHELTIGDNRTGALSHLLDAAVNEMNSLYRGAIGRLMSK